MYLTLKSTKKKSFFEKLKEDCREQAAKTNY